MKRVLIACLLGIVQLSVPRRPDRCRKSGRQPFPGRTRKRLRLPHSARAADGRHHEALLRRHGEGRHPRADPGTADREPRLFRRPHRSAASAAGSGAVIRGRGTRGAGRDSALHGA